MLGEDGTVEEMDIVCVEACVRPSWGECEVERERSVLGAVCLVPCGVPGPGAGREGGMFPFIILF